MNYELRLIEIDEEIRKAEDEKNGAIVAMFVWFLLFFPLAFIGAFQYSAAKKKIEQLNEEKKRIWLEIYTSASNRESSFPPSY